MLGKLPETIRRRKISTTTVFVSLDSKEPLIKARWLGASASRSPTRRDAGSMAKKMNLYSWPERKAPGTIKASQRKLKITPTLCRYFNAKNAAHTTATRFTGPRKSSSSLVNSTNAMRNPDPPSTTKYDEYTLCRLDEKLKLAKITNIASPTVQY